MPIVDNLKGLFIRRTLEHIRDGDKGSSIVGVAAVILTGLNLKYGLLMQGFQTQESTEQWGIAIGGLIVGLIAHYFVGRGPAATSGGNDTK